MLSKFHICLAIALASTLGCVGINARAQDPTPAPVQAISSGNAPVEGEPSETLPAELFLLPGEQHHWTRFPVGSWRQILITTETFAEPGESISRSVTTQQENLQSISNNRYALEVQATVDVVGKRIVGQWITRVLQSATDQAGQIIESQRQEDQTVELTTGQVNCQVWDVLYRDDTRSLVDRIYYSPERFPFVLRRETSEVSSGEGDPLPVEQVVSVVAEEIPYVVDGETLRGTCLQTTRRGEKGSMVRISIVSQEVPGGELAAWSTDFDAEGRRSRWSSQELIGHGLAPLAEKPLSRRQLRRARRNR